MTHLCRRLVPALILLAAASCSGRPAVVPVQGEAFKDGKPVAGALIVFHPRAGQGIDQLRPTATVDEKGAFRPTTFAADDGLPEGEYAVTVVWPAPSKGDTMIRVGEGSGIAQDRLEGRYSDPKSPQLKATVRKGESNKLRFDLK